MCLQCIIVWGEHEKGQFYHKILKSAAVLEFLLLILVVASLASATTLLFVQIGIQIPPNYLDQRPK